MRERTDTREGTDLPARLLTDLERAGYYPTLVADSLLSLIHI